MQSDANGSAAREIYETTAWLSGVREMKRTLKAEGRDTSVILPADLERFNLSAWFGELFGMTCVPQPVEDA